MPLHPLSRGIFPEAAAGRWSHFTEENTEVPRGNVTQSHTSRMRFQISDFWVMYLPRPCCLEEAGLVRAVVLLKTPSDLQKPPTALTVKSGEQRVGVQGIA